MRRVWLADHGPVLKPPSPHVDVPITLDGGGLDLDAFLSLGQQPDETPLPDDEPSKLALLFGALLSLRSISGAPSQSQPSVDAEGQAALEAMGFPTVRAQKGLLATGNADVEAAMMWILEHSEDPGQSPASACGHRRGLTIRGCRH